jgi:hypothetical protein
MTMKQRVVALQEFRDKSGCNILLLSLSCGAVGQVPIWNLLLISFGMNFSENHRLDLTSASRAYLMEPHWNPQVEEQAFARLHRMGQTREVTTIRFVMNESFEQVRLPSSKTETVQMLRKQFQKHMTKMQIRKSQLAGLLLSHKKVSHSEVKMSRIHVGSPQLHMVIF